MKPRPISELREELTETPAIDFGRRDYENNTLRVLPENLRAALRPLNHKYDALIIAGWNGILPVKPLRDWLEFAPACVLNVTIHPDCIVITGERTRATFKRGTYAPIWKKGEEKPVNLLVKTPFSYRLIAPGPRPTKSELMTILNKERGKILARRRSWLHDLKSFSPQYRAGRLESIERDTKDALTALYCAFGRMQSAKWAEFATPGYLEDMRGLPEKCQALYAEIVAFRDVHNVTDSSLFQKSPIPVLVESR